MSRGLGKRLSGIKKIYSLFRYCLLCWTKAGRLKGIQHGALGYIFMVQIMDNENKIAVYDFCQTLVDFETADEFVHFVTRKTRRRYSDFIETLRKVCIKFKILTIMQMAANWLPSQPILNKKLTLYELKGLSQKQLEHYAKEYYQTQIKPRLIKDIMETVKCNREKGYYLVIVSASYQPFLELFAEEFGFDLLITNRFAYRDDIFSGHIAEKDCYGVEKVNRFKRDCLKWSDKSEVLAYGDSVSDIPVLLYADKAFVISRDKPKEWSSIYGFEEIIWRSDNDR